MTALPSLAGLLAGAAVPAAAGAAVAPATAPGAAFGLLVEQQLAGATVVLTAAAPEAGASAASTTPAEVPAGQAVLAQPTVAHPTALTSTVPAPGSRVVNEPAEPQQTDVDDAVTDDEADPSPTAGVAVEVVPAVLPVVASLPPVVTAQPTEPIRPSEPVKAGPARERSASATAGTPDQPAVTPVPVTTTTTTGPTVAPVHVVTTPVAALATGPTAPTGSPVPSNPVLDQVLPAVPRIVQRGDGTTRLSLKLHPADLGEVHVTVTVKDGVVDVTLAAGHEARQAMGEAGDRLRAMLSGGGHTAGQVVLRDLAQQATASEPQTQTSPTNAGGTGYQGPTDAGQGGAHQHRPGDGGGRSTHHDATGQGPDPRPDSSTDRRRTRTPAVAGLDVTV